ncbi:uncharacterized protein LOC104897130 [Beta vulgaris subsp. vulgaris]|uniref:Mariner transposase n=2 Tax=Beta vulgaris subsp. vulgaris TaxID=3555 RepID=J3S7K7_BETVV|nr:uncharacterized protein LOC104897130 [Beta vulgaris subsp. vulgaris]AFK13835.1 mariner transposase [Beta vulgaris subsp. vulgaris]
MDEEAFEAWILSSGVGDDTTIGEEELHFEEHINAEEEEEDNEVWYFSDHESENEEQTMNELNEDRGNEEDNKKPNLPNNIRRQIVIEMFASASDELVLPRGLLTTLRQKYSCSRSTMNRIWTLARKQKIDGVEVNVASRKIGNCGRKVKFTDDEALRRVPLKQRTTIRSFATALEVSPSTVYRLLKRGILRSHTNSIKPKLTPKHKVARMKFVLSQSIPKSMNELPKFNHLYNMIHIDEKWFFMSKITQRFYLLSEEEDPYRACQSKAFITKVMFLAAIARPWLGPTGDILWDGKIGIFPFIDEVRAQRWSANRPAGTIEKKAKQSITKETIREMIINKLLPAIRAKWPENGCKEIWIQQDNARPHIQPNDAEFLEACREGGFEINIICQPAQSPDLNILDLGFFKAIQSIQHQSFPKTVDELIKSVEDAYTVYEPRIINYTWIHLMYVMVEILKVKGGNNYKNPHNSKKKMDRLGLLPTTVEISEELVNDTVNLLNQDIVFGPEPFEAMELLPEDQ